jgi:hypothetical protein
MLALKYDEWQADAGVEWSAALSDLPVNRTAASMTEDESFVNLRKVRIMHSGYHLVRIDISSSELCVWETSCTLQFVSSLFNAACAEACLKQLAVLDFLALGK